MFLIEIINFFRRPKPRPRPKISLLIPFKTDNPQRKVIFKWLLEYWKHELPDAEIIIGLSHSKPFSKTEALNNAAEIATGKVLVILDADAYLSGRILERAADRILEEIEEGERLWYVPYRHLYRLNKYITTQIVSSDPSDPLRIPAPPPPEYIDNQGHTSHYGHRYGAMVMVFPREALEEIGCFDERFRGWGGEDVALLRALDTLYAKHKTINSSIFHLWHPFIGHDYRSRAWEKQQDTLPNMQLANAYHRATRRPHLMRELVNEGCRARGRKRRRGRHLRVR